jgi:hypothetical protein
MLTPTTPNTVTLTVLSLDADNSVIGYDLRGTTGGTVDALGTVFITDGQPLGLPSPPSPNIFLILINGALDENGVLTFGVPAVGGVGLQENATFAPSTAISDPALLALVGNPPLMFDWALSLAVPQGNGTTVSTWSLVDVTSAAVPEPASFALIGLGMLALGVVRKRSVSRR